MTLADVLPHRSSPGAEALAERLRSDLTHIGRRSFDAAQTPFWRETCAALLRCADTSDPRDFMRWAPIANTMVARTSPALIGIWRDLRAAADWPDIKPLVSRPEIGAAPPFLAAPWAGAVAIQHASHLLYFRRAMGTDIAQASGIIDLGAGYGGMCRMLKQRGFQGRYIIFDQPPVLALQRYFLGWHGIEADYDNFGADGVALCSSIVSAAGLLPQGSLSAISTWALSEMPLDLRQEIEPLLRRADRALLAYQADFSGIDNAPYFARLAAELGGRILPVPHSPGNHYVFRAP